MTGRAGGAGMLRWTGLVAADAKADSLGGVERVWGVVGEATTVTSQ